MFNKIKKAFEKPRAIALAMQELDEAERQLLVHQSATEYHNQLAAYYRNKVKRLRIYVGTGGVPNEE
jgi:hypothetical protein